MESIWAQSCSIPERDRLNGDMETEIAVIGGGLAGVLTAFLLKKEGCRVMVLEAKRIGSGQTRKTTAKITSQHGMIYRSLVQTLGETRARQYATANQTAVGEYRRIIKEEGISCDFEEQDAYVYGDNVQNLRAEAERLSGLVFRQSFPQTFPSPFRRRVPCGFGDRRNSIR